MSMITERLREIQENQSRQPPRLPVQPPMAEAPTGGEDARKARTRRLIQVGALTDQYLGTIQITEIRSFLKSQSLKS